MRTRVVNIRLERYDVLIDRSTKWGNPFSHREIAGTTKVPTRTEAIQRYVHYIRSKPELISALPELRGKVLGCHCKPLRCHGEILSLMADGMLSTEP